MSKRNSAHNSPRVLPVSPRALTINTRPALPEHFAEHVLDYEIELDLNCNITVLQKLMSLYSSAIEHYESVSDPKYLHYQERLHNLLARKDVITLLNMGSPRTLTSLKPSEVLKKMQEQIATRQKYRAQQVTMYMSNCLSESRVAENILKKHRSDTNMASARIIQNLRTQESPDLEQRAEARRRRSGTPYNSLNNSFNRTLSINSTNRDLRVERYQEEIEDIVERSSQERERKLKELKKRYKEEIRNVRGNGSRDEIIEQVVKQIKENLKVEVEQVEKEIRLKKKEMIEEIRGNY